MLPGQFVPHPSKCIIKFKTNNILVLKVIIFFRKLLNWTFIKIMDSKNIKISLRTVLLTKKVLYNLLDHRQYNILQNT